MADIWSVLRQPHSPSRNGLDLCRHLNLAVEWIRAANEAVGRRGISNGYDLLRGAWAPAYPETTGYTVPTLLNVANLTDRGGLRAMAIDLADYLLTQVTAEGGVAHWQDESQAQPIIFDTGQVLFGWLAAYGATSDRRFLDASRSAADWIVSAQHQSGSWRTYQHLGVEKVIDTRVAWALLSLRSWVKSENYEQAAKRNLEWALQQQEPDGWFRHCAFVEGDDPFTHTLAYTAEGLLDRIQVAVCATGQHRSMLDQALNVFDVVPQVDLDLMEEGQTPSQVASRLLARLDPVLVELKPDHVLVQGDTTTVMAAAIAAHHRQVPVGHVEAGLRTYDRRNPFPEEMNRVVADHVSDLLFAPTARARSNLLREGIGANRIFVTGNTVIDALLWIIDQPLSDQSQELLVQHDLDEFFTSQQKRLILVTAHRRENHGKPIRQICQAILDLARSRPDWHIIYPVHPNPNIWNPVHKRLAGVAGVTILPPVDYSTLTHLMTKSYLILTDSGGIQEEAPALGIPVLVMREVTERPEAVEAGAVRLVGTEPGAIVRAAQELLDDRAAYERMAKAVNPYGDGHAARRIADVLLSGSCIEFSPQNSAATLR